MNIYQLFSITFYFSFYISHLKLPFKYYYMWCLLFYVLSFLLEVQKTYIIIVLPSTIYFLLDIGRSLISKFKTIELSILKCRVSF